MEKQPQSLHRPTEASLLISFIIVSIAWGTTYGGIKLAVETIPPMLMAGTRFLLAGVLLYLFLLLVLKMRGPTISQWKRIIPVGVLLLGSANTLLGFAQQYVDSAFAALMVNSGPFIYVGIASILGEKVSGRAWFGLTVGFLGLLVLVYPDMRDSLSGEMVGEKSGTYWWAIAALVAGPFSWSCGSIVARRNPVTCHPLMVAACQSIAGGAFAMMLSIITGEAFNASMPSTASMWAIVYLVVVGSWLGYVSYMQCVMHLPTQRTGSITYINMIVAVLVAVLFLGEKVNHWMILGGLLTLTGVWIVNTAKKS